MKAVILPTGNVDALKPFTDSIPEFLMPIVNKPIVEHLIELLVRHGIKDIIVVLKHMPCETRKYFGKGERWGVNISYALERDFKSIGFSLQRIGARLDEPFLCLPGNCVTNLNITQFIQGHENRNGEMSISQPFAKGGVLERISSFGDISNRDYSPFIMTPRALSFLPPNQDDQNFKRIAESIVRNQAHLYIFKSWHDFKTVNTLSDFWEVNKSVLKGELNGIIIPGQEREKGLWVGTHTKVHPEAKWESPVLIGNNCKIHKGVFLGRETIIGNNILIDDKTSAQNSIVMDNTYVGAHTEITDSIIRKNRLFNVPKGINTFVSDDFILGDIKRNFLSAQGSRLFGLITAVFLLFIFSPLLLIGFLYHLMFSRKKFFLSQSRFGDREVVDLKGNMKSRPFNLLSFRSKNRFIQKLPGLFNVIKGDLSLIGNSPLTDRQTASLKEEWETLRFKAPIGLFHLWEVEGVKEKTWEEKVAMENYYAMDRSFPGDLKILFKSLSRVFAGSGFAGKKENL